MNNVLPAPTTLTEFLSRVLILCCQEQCSITSWARTELRNAAVGGSLDSQHLLRRGATAVDIVPDKRGVDLTSHILRSAFQLGLVAIDEGDHIHIQMRSATTRTRPKHPTTPRHA